MKAELARRKLFAKLAHELYKVWPEYNSPLPAPKTKTDKCAQCEMRDSLEVLKATWAAVRTGKATDEEFERAVTRWQADRTYNAMILGLVNKYGESIKDKK